MFVLIKVDHIAGVDCELIGTYNGFNAAHDAMEASWRDEPKHHLYKFREGECNDFFASWTTLPKDMGIDWHIFDSDDQETCKRNLRLRKIGKED